MPLPTPTELSTMDYSFLGSPFVEVPARSGLFLETMYYSFLGSPFVPNPEIVVLVVSDVISSTTIENVDLTQHQILSVSDDVSSTSIDSLLLVQHQILSVSDIILDTQIDTITLFGVDVTPEDILSNTFIDSIQLTVYNPVQNVFVSGGSIRFLELEKRKKQEDEEILLISSLFQR